MTFAFAVSVALKSIAILSLAWGVAWLMRNRSAASRHVVWIAAAMALLALPFLSASLPDLKMPGSRLLAAATATFQTTATADAAQNTASVHASQSDPTQQTTRALRIDWQRSILWLWALGIAIGLARLLLGYIAMWRVQRQAILFANSDLPIELAHSLGLYSRVDVLQTAPGSMPMTFGFWRPVIFMPADANQWTEDRRRIVLLHELAHVLRGDVGAHLITRVILTLYWWNPLAWIAWREFLKERERATDDLVLHAGARASDYAGHLVDVARSHASHRLGWAAAVPMARRSQLESRVVAILDTKTNRAKPNRAAMWIAVAIAIVMVVPLAAVRAQDSSAALPGDIDVVIRAAVSQRNHEILEMTATGAEQRQKFDIAKKLLESAAEIRGQVSGQQSADYAIGLMKLGELEQRRNNRASAQDFYTRAIGILGDRPESAKALTFLGTSAVLNKDLNQAVVYYQRAQNADPANSAIPIMWTATVRAKQGDTSVADALFQNALNIAKPDSSEAATVMHVYSQFLHQDGRPDVAGQFERQAVEIDKSAESASHTQVASNVYKIGGDVTQPKLIRKVEPEYTEEARTAKIQGTVQMLVTIREDGAATDFRVTQALGLGLDQKAIDAVRQWQFQPGTKEGVPVPVIATIQVNFRLL